jgi:hypothetical protein
MDFSMVIGVAIYLGLLVLIVVSIAHKTGRVIDLVQETASYWRSEGVPVEVLDPEALTLSKEKSQEHFLGQSP